VTLLIVSAIFLWLDAAGGPQSLETSM